MGVEAKREVSTRRALLFGDLACLRGEDLERGQPLGPCTILYNTALGLSKRATSLH